MQQASKEPQRWAKALPYEQRSYEQQLASLCAEARAIGVIVVIGEPTPRAKQREAEARTAYEKADRSLTSSIEERRRVLRRHVVHKWAAELGAFIVERSVRAE